MRETCNCTHQCSGECPRGINCPLDKIAMPKKDRAISRKRHHSMVKQRSKSQTISKILSAKANKLPFYATAAEISRAEHRAKTAQKKAEKYQKNC